MLSASVFGGPFQLYNSQVLKPHSSVSLGSLNLQHSRPDVILRPCGEANSAQFG